MENVYAITFTAYNGKRVTVEGTIFDNAGAFNYGNGKGLAIAEPSGFEYMIDIRYDYRYNPKRETAFLARLFREQYHATNISVKYITSRKGA